MLPSEIVLQIEEILSKRGIKKAEFYAKTGVSAASFSHWRKNEHVPELKALKSVNAFLGTNFGIAEIKEKAAPSEGGVMSEARIAMMAELDGMTEDEIWDIIESVKAAKAIIANSKKRKSPAKNGEAE